MQHHFDAGGKFRGALVITHDQQHRVIACQRADEKVNVHTVQRSGGAVFEIPFNRQQLADYLSVDRSALSTELGKLKAEGLLDFDRSSFKMKR